MASVLHHETIHHGQETAPAYADIPADSPHAHHANSAKLARLSDTFRLPDLARHAAETAADLADWGRRFPLADSRRFGALALTTAVHLPGLSRRDRALAARLNGWIYAFDDLIDGVPLERSVAAIHTTGRLPDTALDRLVVRCNAVLTDQAPRAHGEDPDGILAALAALVGEVRTHTCPPPLVALWRETFARMLTGILRERRLVAELADGAAPPSPSAYLETARYSIGAPHYLATCFILQSDADDPGLPGRLPTLTALALAAADIARLANDLRTWMREEGEGTYNSIRAADAAIARLMPVLPAAERRAQALRAIEHLLTVRRARVEALLQLTPEPHREAEAGIGRLVTFLPALYATADFHDFGSASPAYGDTGRDE